MASFEPNLFQCKFVKLNFQNFNEWASKLVTNCVIEFDICRGRYIFCRGAVKAELFQVTIFNVHAYKNELDFKNLLINNTIL